MNKLPILIIGRHAEIVQTLIRLVNNQPDWIAYGCLSDEEALGLFEQYPISLVLFSSGLSAESTVRLRQHFMERRQNVRIIQHYGGGSGLLKTEIYQAINKTNRIKIMHT